ncbi:YlmC/YmxH family sporulation protein [Melghiribacillus thermohalophilus]|uniref:YlmC/YmxH family sporulation protein n=1 Tax=Melghiribacillus thermohalophilus TaxID=1324956 RepID=A0A4R3NAS3_9BACI|nr:YlmC/YmxH family sporulation protein [Melghiribacillus thermohalophilus]TCT26719.1 YlmC/YmxH family sporulation protein [Melghiribacillus thermohalophilus]
MRFRDLSGKELIDISEGERLGVLGQTDLEIDPRTGKIKSIIIPDYKWFGVKKGEQTERINWNDIETIGDDMIIVNPAKNKI